MQVQQVLESKSNEGQLRHLPSDSEDIPRISEDGKDNKVIFILLRNFIFLKNQIVPWGFVEKLISYSLMNSSCKTN